jgi:hypothetical protein
MQMYNEAGRKTSSVRLFLSAKGINIRDVFVYSRIEVDSSVHQQDPVGSLSTVWSHHQKIESRT